MAGYGSYQGSGSYLEAAQGNMGFGTVQPGMFTPSHNQGGYGVYLGDAASTELATERMARDVAKSRVDLSEAAKFQREMADHEDYMAQRANRQEAAELAHEQRRITAESLRQDFALKNSSHAMAMEEQDEKARIYSEMRKQRETQRQKPLYLLLTELYNEGSVSPEALQEYNEMNPDGQLSDFRQDPNTGELYGVSADGKSLVPFEGQGVLDTWAKYHPDAQEWALSAMPPQVREQKKAQFELARKATQERLNQEKFETEAARKAQNDYISMMKQTVDMLNDDIKTLSDQLKDSSFDSEEARVSAQTQLQDLIKQRRHIIMMSRKIWDPNGAVGGAGNDTDVQNQNLRDSAATSGVSVAGGVQDWTTLQTSGAK